mmetsp:Transcript_44661/g.118515  ORF Transcript_44661/g.118515 Transcript_44661/m.118515 type:complete len:271 (+) Transcript_44661:910-1722(+)
MEGAVCTVDKTGDAILHGLWRVASFQFGHPLRVLACRLYVKAACIQQHRGAHSAVRAVQQKSTRIEFLQDFFETAQFFSRDQIRLVQDEDIGKLNLLDQEVHDLSPIRRLRSQLFPVGRFLSAVVVLQKMFRIDYGHQSVQARNIAKHRHASSISSDESGRNGHGFRNASALNEQIIEPTLERERTNALYQIFAERATDATIVQIHQLVLALLHLHAVLQKRGIDIDLGHVVHQDSNSQTRTVVEYVGQKSRLASSKKTTQQCDRQLIIT